MELVFIVCAAIVAYMFIGYPLLLWLLVLVRRILRFDKETLQSQDYHPAVSIVIAAHNEEQNVRQRLENLFEQNYDLRKLQIIVGSDGSSDQTLPLLREYEERAQGLGVDLMIIEFAQRGGKPRVLNEAIQHCKHDIVLLADVRQTFSRDAVRNIARRFANPAVGAVSGELFLKEPTDQDSIADMGAYWRYEKLIRKLEARLHSTIGATGAIYAIRKSLFKSIPDRTLIDDVVIPMQICMQGYRVLFADDAHAYDVAPTDSNKEWLRKVRTLAGNWQMMVIRPKFLSPLANPVWLQFISHKILRLSLPFCLLGMLVSSFLLEGTLYSVLFMMQCMAYLIGALSFFIEGLRQLRIPGLIYFFCILNAAILVGFYRLASGKKDGLWSFAYKSAS